MLRNILPVVLILLIHNSCTVKETREGITDEMKIVALENGLAIEFDGKIRMKGGKPVLKDEQISGMLINNGVPGKFLVSDDQNNEVLNISVESNKNTAAIYLKDIREHELSAKEYAGIFFNEMPDYKEGVAYWRYKPWNSWTKPMKISNPLLLKDWDVQCYYWKYNDNTYGAMVPLSGNGFRTTLGSTGPFFGSKAVSYVNDHRLDSIPAMVIAFDKDPYKLMEDIYTAAMKHLDEKENLIGKKSYPEPLEYIGWCTWNASSKGSNLNEGTVIEGVESFTDNGFPLGWVLIDDGWFDNEGSRLKSLHPDPVKFSNGFEAMVDKLKNDHGLKHVGIWHAINGYWNGIHPDSKLGEKYEGELFSWQQKERPDLEDAPVVTYHFLKPDVEQLYSFYDQWHSMFKDWGFSFVKVDNQLVVERMAVNNYPIWDLARTMHSEMNKSVKKHFDNAIINCMDMTNDAFYNFGSTPVARSVEDYFPYEEGENYNLEKGNAAAHVLQAIYNAHYFSQMVYPDFDMFQSHNPNGAFHAIARAINNGPIYITDNVGEQNFNILNKLVYNDGKIIRSHTPLLPTEDCLFQVQDPTPFKAFSFVGNTALVGVWNCADADQVAGQLSPSDAHGIKGEDFAVYEHFSGSLQFLNWEEQIPVQLDRLAYQLYYIVPSENGIAPFGLINKYNAPSTIQEFNISKDKLTVKLEESGIFACALPMAPKQILVNGKEYNDYSFEKKLLKVSMKDMEKSSGVHVEVLL